MEKFQSQRRTDSISYRLASTIQAKINLRLINVR